MATYLRSRCLTYRDAVRLCLDLAAFYTRTGRPERASVHRYARGFGVYVTTPDDAGNTGLLADAVTRVPVER
jgi:hypothetical protein